MAVTIVNPANLQRALSNAWGIIDARKANKIEASNYTWTPSLAVPRGVTLAFETSTEPVLTPFSGDVAADYALVNGQPDLFFGFWTNDGGETTHLGLFRSSADDSEYVSVQDIYNSTNGWISATYVTKYGFDGAWTETFDAPVLTGFAKATNIAITNHGVLDLIHVYELLGGIIESSVMASHAYTDLKVESISVIDGDTVVAMTNAEVDALIASIFGGE
ncbi:MAG: hypothetical protein LBP59_10475 [Planctomycetaceae bacterium]|jgi:hypothetical protein|nr:hypothetical protein [Planctomycetaceae bacterium]